MLGLGRTDARWPRAGDIRWLSPEELVEEGFRRSQVVMLNEARSGLKRCIRTRRIGVRVLPVARASGARLLAMEALGAPGTPPRTGGVLDQPDLQELIAEAGRQGLRVAGYDVDDATSPLILRTKVKTPAFTNWRDARQAANLAALFAELAPGSRMLVWCANLHLSKVRFMQYRPTGWRFLDSTGVEPFVIDQTVTVNFMGRRGDPQLVRWARGTLAARGGSAGFLWEEGLPRLGLGADAWILSLDNRLE
jgi:hypothetical protein